VLDNGAVLVSQALASNPFIAFRGSLRAGTAAESLGEVGVAEFAARLLLSGTRRASAARISDRLEGIGATLEFQNSEEVLAFHGRCTRETVAETVRILVECLSQPSFPPKEVERVRASILTDLRHEADDPRARALREAARTVFPKGHPYGRDPKGDERRIRSIDRRAIARFHDAHVSSEGLILAASGDIDAALVEDAIARPLARLRERGTAPSPIPPPSVLRAQTLRVPMPHKSQVDIVVAAPAVSRRHDDFYALNLANLLFGRIGLYGRLGKSVRDDQGLAYYSYSTFEARTAGGWWTISAGVNPNNLERAVRAIREEMERLRTEPFSYEELRDGRDNQVGSLVVNLERNAEVASELHRMEYFGLGMDFLERYASIVRDLPDARIREVARKYFDPNAASLVVAGPIGRARVAL
jgi:zinc protease